VRDRESGAVIDCHWFESHEEPVTIATWWAEGLFGQPVVEEFGGQADVDAFFRGKKAVPQTLNFIPVITGCPDRCQRAYTKLNIFKKLTFGAVPPETEPLLQALNWAANHRAEHAVRAAP
jgi:hypothetical protein